MKRRLLYIILWLLWLVPCCIINLSVWCTMPIWASIIYILTGRDLGEACNPVALWLDENIDSLPFNIAKP